MPISLNCTNKGCGKSNEPYIDLSDNKVYCSLCEREITNVTIFTVNLMKSSKQVRQKKTTAFAIKCPKCSREERPKLLNNDVVCGACSKSLDNLSLAFKNMLKEKLKTINKDV